MGCAQSRPAPAQPALSADSVRSLAGVLLPPEATQHDLALLSRAYRLLHPGLTRYQSLVEWDATVDSLHRWFEAPRSRGETYLALARLTASVRCSHTYLNFWNQPTSTRRWLLEGRDKLPFTFRLLPDDRWVVERSAATAPTDPTVLLLHPGDTILSVNGMATPALVARLLPYIRGDGDNDGKRRSLLEFQGTKKYQATDVFLPLLLPPVNGRYTLEVRHGDGGSGLGTVVVASLDARTRMEIAEPVPAPRPTWSLTLEGDVGVLTVDGFEGGEGGSGDQWTPFVRATFRRLERAQMRVLILDIRQNEGGADAAAALLLSHLIRDTVTLPPLRRFVQYDTVPADLRPVLSTWDKDFYDRRGRVRARGDGTYDVSDGDDWPKHIAPAREAFRGRVLVLTSPVNSSASHIMMRLLARQPNVTVIGEPTGGSLRASTGGNLFFLQLVRTGFEADVPLIAYDWGADQPTGGVQPDISTAAVEALTRARLEAQSPGH